ncbi:Potassium transporter 4 [Glycine soja]|nr:Potassium transporter 4 [Glycine soja]
MLSNYTLLLGGTFALYSLLCRHANFSLLPNQQAADEELSCYKNGPSLEAAASSSLKRFLENHRSLKTALLVMMLLGACMVIVLASVSGLRTTKTKFTDGEVVLIACVILVGLFALQRYGTHKVVFVFAPVVIIWLFFIKTGKEGWISLGGMLLCITGTEAMFADIGHFTTVSIRLAFSFVIYPCLVVQYMDQAAFLSKNLNSVHNSFYDSTGLAYMTVMFVTTFLMALVIMFVWQKSILIAIIFLLFFWVIEGVYLSAALVKVFQGGWVPLVSSFIFMLVILIYTELATGIPAIFSHFVTNLPAFHMVLFFVCLKTVPVPHVSHEERYLIWRVCRRPCQMYSCTVRYGYKHIRRDDRDFDNHIIRCIAEFIQMEAQELQLSFSETSSFDGGTAIISVRSLESVSSWKVSENEDVGVDKNNASGRSFSVRRPLSTYNEENPHSRRRHISFRVPNDPVLDHEVKQELLDLAQTMEAGVQLWLLTFLTSVSLKLE